MRKLRLREVKSIGGGSRGQAWHSCLTQKCILSPPAKAVLILGGTVVICHFQVVAICFYYTLIYYCNNFMAPQPLVCRIFSFCYCFVLHLILYFVLYLKAV